jgi:hypothetical protein
MLLDDIITMLYALPCGVIITAPSTMAKFIRDEMREAVWADVASEHWRSTRRKRRLLLRRERDLVASLHRLNSTPREARW